jgi:hypothetical protein
MQPQTQNKAHPIATVAAGIALGYLAIQIARR